MSDTTLRESAFMLIVRTVHNKTTVEQGGIPCRQGRTLCTIASADGTTRRPLIGSTNRSCYNYPGFVMIYGLTRCINDACITNCTRANTNPFLVQMTSHGVHDFVVEFMCFQQLAESAHCSHIWRRCALQVHPGKPSHGDGIVQGFLNSRIRHPEPLLHKKHSQHDRKSGRAAALTNPRIMWLDHGF